MIPFQQVREEIEEFLNKGQEGLSVRLLCPTTIDGIAKLMMEDWHAVIEQNEEGWFATAFPINKLSKGGPGVLCAIGKGITELEARTRLTLQVFQMIDKNIKK